MESQENSIFFAHFRATKDFSRRPDSLILLFLDFHRCVKFEEKKLMNMLQENLVTELRMDVCTGKHEFKGPFLFGVQKLLNIASFNYFTS